jgi:dienelactone hydrolase
MERRADTTSSVEIPMCGGTLDGDLVVPRAARGLVVFAHGSGSSHLSPRNRFVARQLTEGGLATLLFDLLTAEEEQRDMFTGELRFDIPFLADRLAFATRWVVEHRDVASLSIGYFGASTGAAAALRASTMSDVGAIVSRGGRPDLAGDALEAVRAPTLFIVGGNDPLVLGMNQEAMGRMPGPGELQVVPGASHLFEEPGALEQVAEYARSWFNRYLTPRS